jgi:hypothetical protein
MGENGKKGGFTEWAEEGEVDEEFNMIKIIPGSQRAKTKYQGLVVVS